MSAKGGITEGKSHKEGGIPMVVKSTGQQVELEGGEGVINKRNMASKKTFEFEGKEKTICEIASEINSADGNGVQIDCDNVTGKKYKYNKGGKILNEEQEQSFKEWMEDGNVHKFEDGYSTQDAQWSNRLKGLDELRRYFRKEFLSDSYNYGKGGWLLINADTERIIQEYDTESEARQMSYEYDGDSFVMAKSELEKEKSRETYRPPAPLNPATYIGMERGGSIDVETYDYNQLIGKYVNIYSMGVELPSEHRIEGFMFSSPQFRYRDLTLKFDRGIAPINIEDIPKFLNNDIVFVNDNKEDFGVQLIPNQFAKGGKTNNMKLEDYETASMSMGGYEDGAIDANPTEFANGGGVDLPKANKMFHLPLELAVYVPSTQDVDKVISDSELKERVDEVSEYLARLFGGFTKSDKVGGFMSSKSELVTEEVVPVVSFATKSDFNANKDKLVNQLSQWAKRWGQEAIGFEFEGDLYYVPEKFAKGGVVEFVDTKRTDKNYYFLRFEDSIGSFAWIYKGKYNEGLLYPLDDFDKEYYSHIPLKSGEKLYRYATERMSLLDKYAVKPFNNVRYLIKFNLDKGLIYFMSEDNDPNDDKNIQFDTRGTKADYIVIDKERFAEGGGVGDNYYRISISENDKYIGEYPHSIENIIDAKTIFVQLANQYKRPQYLISVYRRPTSSNGYEKINVNEWYDYIEGFANGGDVRDMSWYQDFKKQELKRGTEHEMEHIDTIKKFKKEGVSDKEVAKAIAQDHLDENDSYYIELEKMEKSSKKVNETLKDFDKHRTYRKNSPKFRLGGNVRETREKVHLMFTEDYEGIVRTKEGKYFSESFFPKDVVYTFSFLLNDGNSTSLELGNTGIYMIVPNKIINVVGFDESKFGNGGSVQPYQSFAELDENDKSILKMLLKIDPYSATMEQREKISSFKGTNVVNELSSSMIQKIYSILFKYHNVEHRIMNLYLSNIGVGNILMYSPIYLEKTIISYDDKNKYAEIEKEISSIVTIGKRANLLQSDTELKDVDAIIHVYPESNPIEDSLVSLFYKTSKAGVALGVCEFTTRERLNKFQQSILDNQADMAQNQMMIFRKSNDYLIVNEGITDEADYTLIYVMNKF